MSYQIECEKRVMITFDQYQTLLSDFEGRDSFIVNEYLDNEDSQLHDERLMLRIRTIDNNPQMELTLKIKNEEGDIEVTDIISQEEKSDIIRLKQLPDGEVKRALIDRGISTNNMIIWGYIEVNRREVEFEQSMLVIDENHIQNTIDYNIEVEAKNIKKAEKVIKNLCENYHLNYQENYLSKSRRTYMIYHGLM